MRNRRPVKDAHEIAVINDFIDWLNDKDGTKYEIVARPDPPDAILKDVESYMWVEHTDLYRSDDEAREEYEAILADPGETPFVHSENPVIGPDERIANSLLVNLCKKLIKSSYRDAFDLYGPGIIIMTERDPLFSNSSLTAIKNALHDFVCEDDQGHFKEVFLGYRAFDKLIFWRIYPGIDEIKILI